MRINPSQEANSPYLNPATGKWLQTHKSTVSVNNCISDKWCFIVELPGIHVGTGLEGVVLSVQASGLRLLRALPEGYSVKKLRICNQQIWLKSKTHFMDESQ